MKRISIGTFDFEQEDVESVVSAMNSGFLSTGEETKQFEDRVSSIHDKKYGIMVNSGQSALETSLEYAKHFLKKEKLKVLCPSTTYASTLWAIIRTGCVPVFCDIDKDYNISTNTINRVKEDFDMILSVDLCGKNASLSQDILDKYFIIEDACESFGNKECIYGDIICFSFYVSHIITTGSGGMVCTSDKLGKDWIESFIAHGRTYGGDFTKFNEEWIDKFLFDKIGASFRSDNLSASLGVSQLNRLEKIITKRKNNAIHLSRLYKDNPFLVENFTFPNFEYVNSSIFQFYPILINNDKINREKLLSFLFERRIDSRVLLSLTNQSPVMSRYGPIGDNYPFSFYCNSKGFVVGCHQNLTEENMKTIIVSINDYARECL